MGEAGAERVKPGPATIDDDAGEIGGVGLDRGHLVPVEKILDEDRDEALVAGDGAVEVGALVSGQGENLLETVERCGGVGGLLDHQQRAPVLPVAGEGDAETIDDLAADRGDEAAGDAVAAGKEREMTALQHLHLVEPAGEQGEAAEFGGGDEGGAAGEGGAGLVRVAEKPRHAAWSGSAMPRWAAGSRMRATSG